MIQAQTSNAKNATAAGFLGGSIADRHLREEARKPLEAQTDDTCETVCTCAAGGCGDPEPP